jgi:hypothetical protein
VIAMVNPEAEESMPYEIDLLFALEQGDVEVAAGVGPDADDVMAEARALLAEVRKR